jgi:S-adenosylmethionine decarboxylase
MGERRGRRPQVKPNGIAVGCHVLLDLCGVDSELLRDQARLAEILRNAAIAARSCVLSCHFHSFGERGGVTGVVLLAESHISIHTWPEYEFAAADIFMCGSADSAIALERLVAALMPSTHSFKTEVRGLSQASQT